MEAEAAVVSETMEDAKELAEAEAEMRGREDKNGVRGAKPLVAPPPRLKLLAVAATLLALRLPLVAAAILREAVDVAIVKAATVVMGPAPRR